MAEFKPGDVVEYLRDGSIYILNNHKQLCAIFEMHEASRIDGRPLPFDFIECEGTDNFRLLTRAINEEGQREDFGKAV